MSEKDDPRLSLQVGGQSVGANLDRAIESGAVIHHDDGSLTLRDNGDTEEVGRRGGFIERAGATKRPCMFRNKFLFEHAYAETAVPLGCAQCYKIKVTPKTLRQLMAVKEIAEATPLTTKSGSDLNNPHNPYVYSTSLYFDGLAAARETYPDLRESIEGHEHLGPEVPMTIKRGCSNYERKCGPSDQYAFDPGMAEVEAYLSTRFVKGTKPRTTPKPLVNQLKLLLLIKTAYRIGDETYKDFTGGRPLQPPSFSYSPDETP